MHSDDLDEQPLPEDAQCPACGAAATDESVRRHKLSAHGYLHDDQMLCCTECSETWTLGVPIGDYEGGELVCDACAASMAVHRVAVDKNGARRWAAGDRGLTMTLHLKCPACKLFETIEKDADEGGVVLVGNPRTAGQTDGACSYGYPREADTAAAAAETVDADADADADVDAGPAQTDADADPARTDTDDA